MNGHRGGREPPGQPGQSGEICRNFQKGRCKWGSQCVHRHVNGRDDSRQGGRDQGDYPQSRSTRPSTGGKLLPELYKTEVCKNFLQGQCTFGDNCWFLHSDDSRNPDVPQRRQSSTKGSDEFEVCRKHLKGECTRGDSCWYVHVEPHELVRSPGMPPELKQKKLEVCRKFAKGQCDRADACWFIHAASVLKRRRPSDKGFENQPVDLAEKSEELCRKHLRGACTRGDRCWYKHDDSAGSRTNVQPYNGNPPQLSNPAQLAIPIPTQQNMPVNRSNMEAISQLLQQINTPGDPVMSNPQQHLNQDWQAQQQLPQQSMHHGEQQPQMQPLQRGVLPFNALGLNQVQAQVRGQDGNALSQTGPGQSWISQPQNTTNAQPHQQQQDQLITQLQQMRQQQNIQTLQQASSIVPQQQQPQLNARPPAQIPLTSAPIANQAQHSQRQAQAVQAQQSLHMLLQTLQSKGNTAPAAPGQVVQQGPMNPATINNANEAIVQERSDTLGRRTREDYEIPVMNVLPEQKKTRTDVQPINAVPGGMSQPLPAMNSLPLASRPDHGAHGGVNPGVAPVGPPNTNTTATMNSPPMMMAPGGNLPVQYLNNQAPPMQGGPLPTMQGGPLPTIQGGPLPTMQGGPLPTTGPVSQALDSQQQNICY